MSLPPRNPAYASLSVASRRRAALELAAKNKVDMNERRMIQSARIDMRTVKATIDERVHILAFDGTVEWRESALRPEGELKRESKGYVKVYSLGALGVLGITEMQEIFLTRRLPGRHLIIIISDTPLHVDRHMYWFRKCETLVIARYGTEEVNRLALLHSDDAPKNKRERDDDDSDSPPSKRSRNDDSDDSPEPSESSDPDEDDEDGDESESEEDGSDSD